MNDEVGFLTEAEPARETPLPVTPGIRRIVAFNPGPMTYHGTNTYLIERPEGVVVLDPGPDQRAHVEAIMEAAAGKVALILVSHTHVDHVGAVPALRAATGAAVAGFRDSALEGFRPDIALGDGDTIAGFVAVHTPGHASDHLCFAMTSDEGARVLFSADHVMSWSTSVVSPPRGDMRAYFASLRLLLERDDELYLPGHGPPLWHPQRLVRGLLRHREARERAIAAVLRERPASIEGLTDAVYSATPAVLRRAAERNVLAHLLKLEAENLVEREGELWRSTH